MMKNNLLRAGLSFLSVIVAVFIFFRVEAFRMGGPALVLILLSSIFAVAVIFEKLVQFLREGTDTQLLLKEIFESIERQRIKEALDLCDQARTCLARVLKAGIMKYDRSKEEIREAIQDSFLYEIPILENRLPVLATIIQVVPLFGFLGTLMGLLHIFQAIEAKGGSFSPLTGADFSQGIWQALISPAASFFVCIPALVAYNYFNNRVKLFVEEMERASTQLLNFLIDRRMP